MVFCSPHWLSSLFSIHFSLFFSDWIIPSDLSSASQILSFFRSSRPCSLLHFHFIHCILQLQNFYLVLFYDSSLSSFTFCPCIILLISLNCLSVFSYSSLSSLKTTILNFLSGKAQVSISLRLIPEKLLCSFDGVMFLSFIMIPKVLHCYLCI